MYACGHLATRISTATFVTLGARGLLLIKGVMLSAPNRPFEVQRCFKLEAISIKPEKFNRSIHGICGQKADLLNGRNVFEQLS